MSFNVKKNFLMVLVEMSALGSFRRAWMLAVIISLTIKKNDSLRIVYIFCYEGNYRK